jgi:NTP pyrophosphatase (non-canonical NTP hydrolase)
MNLNEYQNLARETAIYPAAASVIYPILGLNGEAGECAEKVKKQIRDGVDNTEELILELGDVLWYLANAASDLGVSLDDVARLNIEKLHSRKARGTLHGSGDSR